MEDLLKDALPKEVIEVQDAIQQVVEPEPSGLTWYQGIGIIALVIIVAAAAKKVRCCKKKCQRILQHFYSAK